MSGDLSDYRHRLTVTLSQYRFNEQKWHCRIHVVDQPRFMKLHTLLANHPQNTFPHAPLLHILFDSQRCISSIRLDASAGECLRMEIHRAAAVDWPEDCLRST